MNTEKNPETSPPRWNLLHKLGVRATRVLDVIENAAREEDRDDQWYVAPLGGWLVELGSEDSRRIRTPESAERRDERLQAVQLERAKMDIVIPMPK